MHKPTKQSLIITLIIDDTAQQFFNEKRLQFYPAYANFVPAHLTLFYNLPVGNNLVQATLLKMISTVQFQMKVNSLICINNFVAYQIESSDLANIHLDIQFALKKFLHYKDLQPLWPHITIQNKGTAYKAFKTHQYLTLQFAPFNITALGFSTWLYANKRWAKDEDFLFKNNLKITNCS